MSERLIALLAGTVFGVGLAVSGMIDPGKVQAFLDVAGHWDPSLLVVLGTAVTLNTVAFRWSRRQLRPLIARQFHIPSATALDARLIGGSALFGVGWGLTGYCPGPAISALALGSTAPVVFLVGVIVGMTVHARLFALPDAPPTAQA